TLALRLEGRNSGYGYGFGELRSFCSAVRQRLAQDRVDIAAYRATDGTTDRGALRLCELLQDYVDALNAELAVDFASLEEQFLDRIESGTLAAFSDPLQALFVDEYQDTNYLQESIYFALLRQIASRNGSITVVGDDDQSLYRFRSATVDL